MNDDDIILNKILRNRFGWNFKHSKSNQGDIHNFIESSIGLKHDDKIKKLFNRKW